MTPGRTGGWKRKDQMQCEIGGKARDRKLLQEAQSTLFLIIFRPYRVWRRTTRSRASKGCRKEKHGHSKSSIRAVLHAFSTLLSYMPPSVPHLSNFIECCVSGILGHGGQMSRWRLKSRRHQAASQPSAGVTWICLCISTCPPLYISGASLYAFLHFTWIFAAGPNENVRLELFLLSSHLCNHCNYLSKAQNESCSNSVSMSAMTPGKA